MNVLVRVREDGRCWFGGAHRWYYVGGEVPLYAHSVKGIISRMSPLGLDLDADTAVPWQSFKRVCQLL